MQDKTEMINQMESRLLNPTFRLNYGEKIVRDGMVILKTILGLLIVLSMSIWYIYTGAFIDRIIHWATVGSLFYCILFIIVFFLLIFVSVQLMKTRSSGIIRFLGFMLFNIMLASVIAWSIIFIVAAFNSYGISANEFYTLFYLAVIISFTIVILVMLTYKTAGTYILNSRFIIGVLKLFMTTMLFLTLGFLISFIIAIIPFTPGYVFEFFEAIFLGLFYGFGPIAILFSMIYVFVIVVTLYIALKKYEYIKERVPRHLEYFIAAKFVSIITELIVEIFRLLVKIAAEE